MLGMNWKLLILSTFTWKFSIKLDLRKFYIKWYKFFFYFLIWIHRLVDRFVLKLKKKKSWMKNAKKNSAEFDDKILSGWGKRYFKWKTPFVLSLNHLSISDYPAKKRCHSYCAQFSVHPIYIRNSNKGLFSYELCETWLWIRC